MGEVDFDTGIWFPIKKMTWSEKKERNYLNCKIGFVEGAKQYQRLHPELKNLFMPRDINKVMQFRDVLSCSWRNRMPVSRPVEEKLKICLGLNSTNAVDPVEFVARDGGYRHGDLCNIFPEVAPNEQGNYNFVFRGIDRWVMSSSNKPELETISVGAKVTIQPPTREKLLSDEWKKTTIEPPPEAIRMKLYAENYMVGYAPHYIQEFYRQFGEQLKIKILQVNSGVPFEYQFLFLATLSQKAGNPYLEPKLQLVDI